MGGDVGMQIHLDATDDYDWTLVLTYAPWSISVTVNGDGDPPEDLATIDDSGVSIVALLTAIEAQHLSLSLPPGTELIPLKQ